MGEFTIAHRLRVLPADLPNAAASAGMQVIGMTVVDYRSLRLGRGGRLVVDLCRPWRKRSDAL
jgi:hypothetical protein